MIHVKQHQRPNVLCLINSTVAAMICAYAWQTSIEATPIKIQSHTSIEATTVALLASCYDR